MRILVVCNTEETVNLRNVLVRNNIALHENIIFFSNFNEAREFLVKHLFYNKQHIDLIITADKIINNDFDTHLVDWIRESELDYSSKNFKLKSLPVILYDEEIRSSDYFKHNFNAILEKNPNDNHDIFLSKICSIVKTVRLKIFDDLDLLRIDFDILQNGQVESIDLYYHLKIKSDPKHWASRTALLSENFIANPHKLNYDWLEDCKEQMEEDIDKYERILKHLFKYNRTYSEKRVLHALYNQSNWMLRLDLYGPPLHEPSLMKNAIEYEEPDYVLPSAFPGVIPTNITEVKPHLFPIVHKRKRKPGFLKPFNDGLIQLSDYERHVRKKSGRSGLDELVEYKTSKIVFTLLASNDEEKYKNLKRIKELQEDHYRKITFQTHTEKLNQVKLYYMRNIYSAIIR